MSNVLVHARCVQLDTRSVETLRKLAKSGELLHKQVAVLQVLVSSESEDPSSARPSNETVFAVLNVSLSDTPASAAADVAAQALHECLGASVPVPEVTTLDANASVNLPEPVTSNSPASRLQEAARQGAQRTQEAWQSLDSRFGITQKFERAQEQARAQFQELQVLLTVNLSLPITAVFSSFLIALCVSVCVCMCD